MNNIFQTTLAKPVILKGIGLHSGENSEMKVLPSEANTGVIFKRVDLENGNIIHANYQNVSSAKLCTTLENNSGAKVSTIEHLLAALYLAEIDNVLIEINSEEVPIMDGSAKNFLDVFRNSGVRTLTKKRNYLKINEKVEFVDGVKNISIEPSEDSLEIEFQLNYENEFIGKQKNVINFSKDDIDDVSKSRTFCLLQDIEKIKKLGLAKGGSLDNAVVVDEDKILNEGGLRNEKEFVNHKILDLAGDLVLSGYRIIGSIKCQQGGHQLTNLFLRDLFDNKKDKFSIIKLNSKKITKILQNNLTPIAVNA